MVLFFWRKLMNLLRPSITKILQHRTDDWEAGRKGKWYFPWVFICSSNQNNVRWITTFFIFSLDMALLAKRSLGSQKRLLKRWLHLGRRQSYQLKDIFNADEFGLLYKTLCSGEKHSKVQLTGMAVSNALGEKSVRCLWLENLPVPDASSTFVISFADIDLKRKHRWMRHFWGMVARGRL